MIDKFDYLEPRCPLSGGKEFYYPDKEAPIDSIPVDRIIAKVDGLFDTNDYTAAGRLLNYWKSEAVSLKDKRGELAIVNELIGFYRKQNEKEKTMSAIERALCLIESLSLQESVSGATILLNCATAYKAFGMADESLALFIKVETVYKNRLEEKDVRFGGLYNNMALTLADLGEFEKAEEKYLSAIEIMKNAPQGELECAITYINLAHLFEQLSDNQKIAEYLRTAYSLLKTETLEHNGYYAFVLEKCAPSFQYFGNDAIYEELIKESKEIYARA